MNTTSEKERAVYFLDSLQKIAEKSQLPDNAREEIDELRKCVETYSVKVVLIGLFSAGKSAFLNALLGRPLLAENTGPETAVPAELYYAPTEYAVKVTLTGERQMIPIEATRILPTEDCDHYELYLNEPFIRELDGWVIVDMPGLDSTVEAHQNAILRYVDEDSLCLLMVSSIDGEVDINTLQFVQEMQTYRKNIALLVTKSDLNPAGVKSVAEQAKNTVEFYNRVECPTEICSTETDAAEALQQKLRMLLAEIGYERMFQAFFSRRCRKITMQCRNALVQRRDSLGLDRESLQYEIDRAEERERMARAELEHAKIKAIRKFHHEQKLQILDHIEETLTSHGEVIARLAMSDMEGANKYVNRLLRPVLVREMNALALDIDVDLSTPDIQEHEEIPVMERQNGNTVGEDAEKAAEAARDKLHMLQRYTSQYLPEFSEIGDSEEMIVVNPGQGLPMKHDNGDDATKITTGVLTTLAIATDVVAPWLELLISALPGIINFVAKWSAQVEMEAAVQKNSRLIVQNIMNFMEEKLEQAYFPNLLDAIIKQVEQNGTLNLQISRETLTRALEEKSKQEAFNAEQKSEIENALEMVDEIERSLI